MIPVCPPRLINNYERSAHTQRAKRHDMIEDVEWMLRFNAGEHEILTRTGKKPEALKTALHRAGRRDLIPRIFEHDRMINERLGR